MKQIDIDLIERARDAGAVVQPSDNDIERARQLGMIVEPVIVRRLMERSLVSNQLAYEIIANEKSWLIAQRLGWDQVPVEVVEVSSDAARRYRVAAPTTAPLDPIERLQQLKGRLDADKKLTVKQLATEEGIGRTELHHRLRVLTLSQSIQDSVRQGALTIAQARRIACKGLTDLQREQLVKATVNNKWSVRVLEGQIKKVLLGSDSLIQESLERAMTEKLGCDVKLKPPFLTIDYQNNLDVLDGVMAHLGIAPGEF